MGTRWLFAGKYNVTFNLCAQVSHCVPLPPLTFESRLRVAEKIKSTKIGFRFRLDLDALIAPYHEW